MNQLIAALWAVFLCLCVLVGVGQAVGQSLFPAPRETAPGCGESALVWGDWQAQVLAHNPTAILRKVNEAKRVRFLSMYNSLPPVTDHNPDLIAFIYAPEKPTGLLIFIDRGCVILVDAVAVQIMLPYLSSLPEPA